MYNLVTLNLIQGLGYARSSTSFAKEISSFSYEAKFCAILRNSS
jgi:hypothetical protein